MVVGTVVTPVIIDVLGWDVWPLREDYIERFGCEPPEEKDRGREAGDGYPHVARCQRNLKSKEWIYTPMPMIFMQMANPSMLFNNVERIRPFVGKRTWEKHPSAQRSYVHQCSYVIHPSGLGWRKDTGHNHDIKRTSSVTICPDNLWNKNDSLYLFESAADENNCFLFFFIFSLALSLSLARLVYSVIRIDKVFFANDCSRLGWRLEKCSTGGSLTILTIWRFQRDQQFVRHHLALSHLGVWQFGKARLRTHTDQEVFINGFVLK